jgi:hypothetical protein
MYYSDNNKPVIAFKKKIRDLLYDMYVKQDERMLFLFQKHSKRNLRDTFLDGMLKPMLNVTSSFKKYNKNKKKFNFIHLFLYLSKKVNFKKVKHSNSLKNK